MDWKKCRKKAYEVAFVRADEGKVYNTARAGQVYNYLEDVAEDVKEGAFVCRGVVGELYVVPRAKVEMGYDVDPESIGDEWVTARAKAGAATYFCRKPEGAFALATEYGVMKGNREGVAHGEGDWILTTAKETEAGLAPDETDEWIVNGVVFARTYEIIE